MSMTVVAVAAAVTVKGHDFLSDVSCLPTTAIVTQEVAASVALNGLMIPI
jgi:hypothetical protein